MKKLLILLIGFAFTQSIQTKQVEVTITDIYTLPTNNNQPYINMNEYLDLGENNYLVKFAEFIFEDGSDIHDTNGIRFANCDGHGYGLSVDSFGYSSEDGRVNNSCPNIIIDSHGFSETHIPFTLIFHVTGLFEDEGVGLQGDMNDDEIINVIDIVALVNIIIGE